jgi:hypothetical protein
MNELEQYKQGQRDNRIKQVKILAPIGGALMGYLISKGSFSQYAKTPTKKQMAVFIAIGTLIGFGVGYLGIKKIRKEKNK